MRFTNKYKLPAALVRAVEHLVNEPHNKPGEYSVTTLLLGPKEVQLTNRHFEEIEVDVSKELWAVFGTAIHALLERNTRIEDGSLSEHAMRYCVRGEHGEVLGYITGKCDLLTDSGEGVILEDYKTTKTQAVKFEDTTNKWREQLAGYCGMLEHVEGIFVRKVRIIALLKDWSEVEAKRNPDDPDAPVAVLNWDFTDDDVERAFNKLLDNFHKQRAASQLSDDEIEPCTFEERWAKETRYAVVKAGAAKATKVCNTRDEALQLIKTKYGPETYGIEERPGEDTKCLFFCKAKEFCNYYKKKYCVQLKKKEDNDEQA